MVHKVVVLQGLRIQEQGLVENSKTCVGKVEVSLILPSLYIIKLQQGEHLKNNITILLTKLDLWKR
jgi:hypothetical protein